MQCVFASLILELGEEFPDKQSETVEGRSLERKLCNFKEIEPNTKRSVIVKTKWMPRGKHFTPVDLSEAVADILFMENR